MQLTVVGCSGSIPSRYSAASCYLLEEVDAVALSHDNPDVTGTSDFVTLVDHVVHPVETFAYRFEHGGKILTYSGDTGESAAGIGHLVLTHLTPDYDHALSAAGARDTFGGPVSLAAPGRVLDLS